ncbi:MAG: hypothetical protein JNM84_01695 [Planctomycetes bacterium]|nr:hypothetical protein [Planctomycetota bacterium]
MRALSVVGLAVLGATLGALLLGRVQSDAPAELGATLPSGAIGANAPAPLDRWAQRSTQSRATDVAQALPSDDLANDSAAPGSAESLDALQRLALGPLSAAEKAPLYEEEIRRLAELRRAWSALDQAAQDERTHWERLELRSDELRMLATLELLDRDEYAVFPEENPGVERIGRLAGRYGLRVATKDGAPVKVIYPYAAERFPLLAELVPLRRAAEVAAQEALVREFAALPLDRRAHFRALWEQPQLASGNEHEAFLLRYAGVGLELDAERLLLVRP